MDFFDHQDVARKNTGRLVLFFGLAVVAIMVVVYLVVAGVIVGLHGQQMGEAGEDVSLWDPRLLLAVGTATLLIVGGGSLYKVAQLRGGGMAVAELLGGIPLHADNADASGRRLLNVVDEMAIASGTPAPMVFLLEQEGGINAFAAGHTPENAVIGVTRGCIERLDRDQLQGVVAHEFSHILNGDMRLNIKLMGVLHGILVIGLLGQTVLRSLRFAGRSRKGGGGLAGVLAIAVGLLIVGWVGVFFGNLIKAAVSRQREFLADASAVQFTRNPDGIAGALRAIGGLADGSRLVTPRAGEASHMYIASGLSSMFATHPPLDERIRRIDPSWDGAFPELAPADPSHVDAEEAAAFAGLAAMPRRVAEAPAVGAAALSLAGQPTQDHLEYARRLLAGIDPALREAAKDPYGARALAYALVLDDDRDARRRALGSLLDGADPAVFGETQRLLPLVDELDPAARLPLLDLLIPSLRSLTQTQYEMFIENLDAVVKADGRLDLLEWTLIRSLRRHVAPGFEALRGERVLYYGLQRLGEPASLLLSALAWAGHAGDPEAARHAFDKAAAQLEARAMAFLPEESCTFEALDGAIETLRHVAPKPKRSLLRACAVSAAADRQVTVAEAELMRAVADGLGVPMPPVLPGQPLIDA